MDKTKKKNSFQAVCTAYTAVLFYHFLLIWASESASISLPGCPDRCGQVSIPYPFGLAPNCSFSTHFEVSCNATKNGTFTPYLYGTIAILNLSVSLYPTPIQARVSFPVSSQCYNSTTKALDDFIYFADISGSPFRFNDYLNKFVVIGSNTVAFAKFSDGQNHTSVGCASSCSSLDDLEGLDSEYCSGLGCCQTLVPKGKTIFNVEFDPRYNNSDMYSFSRCGYAMLMEDQNILGPFGNGVPLFDTNYITTDDLTGLEKPVILDWAIGETTCEVAQANKSSYACISNNSICMDSHNFRFLLDPPGYFCSCGYGYQGNPYLEGGCQELEYCPLHNPCPKHAKCHNFQGGGYRCLCHFGRRYNNDYCEVNLQLVIGACAGVIVLCFLGLGTYAVNEKRKLSKVEEKYFREHGGRILLEKIQSDQGFGFSIFTKQQIEHATDNFNNANIIGHGGQGTVYKGSLRGQMVAIKKCKITNEQKKKEFGKEMLILSQINHKNIVKILGCCLEVEVPMLVYEFIPNGTLFHHIHNKNQDSHISLSIRLRIAHESAEALAYLHFSASPPIFHGDVKSLNILLDENYTAKVSDFGASVLSPTDEAQFVTLVQGTCGYLDPEYMQSCQLTDKSDVYSFGVVLLELLTCKPVINFDAPEEGRSLSSCFLSAMAENKMHDLLDDEIRSEDNIEVIMEVTRLAKECLNMKGEDRPTMKEVAEELDRIRKLKKHPWSQGYHPEEIKTLLNETSHSIEIDPTDYFSLEKAKKSIAAGR